MFEFVGRDLKRLLGVEGQGRVSHAAAHREGLTGGAGLSPRRLRTLARPDRRKLFAP